MKLPEPHDHAGQRLEIGDQIVVRAIPQELIHDLPEEDVEAINSQIGKTLVISGFSEYGYVELDFVDSLDRMHTIWIEPAYLEKRA